MSNVKRYGLHILSNYPLSNGTMIDKRVEVDGDWIRASDYDSLLLEKASLQNELARTKETLDLIRLRWQAADDEAAELRGKLGRLSVWAVEQIKDLTGCLKADPDGTWLDGSETDTMHSELRQAARQYGHHPKTICCREEWCPMALEEFHFRGIRDKMPEPAEGCGHPGCLHHRTHPCECCGRIGGQHVGGK